MNMKAFFASLIVLLCLVPVCQGAQIHRSFSTIVEESSLVFVGTVSSQASRPGEAGKMIFTDVTFSDVEVVSGTPTKEMVSKESLILSFAGGEWDGQVMKVSGVPEFTTDKRYLVFVKFMVSTVASPIVGSHQGLFPLVQDDITQQWYPLTYGGRGISAVRDDGELAVTPRVERISNAVVTYRPSVMSDRNTTLPQRANTSPSSRSTVSVMDLSLSKSEKPLTLPELLKTVRTLTAGKGEQQ